MHELKRWTIDDEERTREILERVDILAFCFGVGNGCTLKHIDGQKGYMLLEDALCEQWDIYDTKTDDLLDSFDMIEELIRSGWKVVTY